MSKPCRAFYLVFFAFLQILQIFTNAQGQDIEAAIRIDSADPAIVAIEGKRSGKAGGRNLSFVSTAAGIAIPGDRITDLKLFDSKGNAVSYKRFIPGEYVAEADFERWSYRVNVAVSKNSVSTAHASWLSKGSGILMLDDLLPRFGGSDGKASVKIIFDPGIAGTSIWPHGSVYTTEKEIAEDAFSVYDIEKAVFYVGGWNANASSDATFRLTFLSLGEWNFSHHEALQMATEITHEYRKMFGASAADEMHIAIAKFPHPASLGSWEAETRGKNVTIMSADMPFKTQSLQRLHEQLRHEIFHLWLPNGVNLKGNYDWFYEGFALYESLKLGVSLNRIRFDDFLDTLSRAHTFDKALAQRKSLIDASKNRWGGANTQVYARGMLVAFLCDVAMLEASKGKRSVENIFREIFEKHRFPNSPADGNEAVLSALRANKELLPIIEKYINGAEDTDLATISRFAGIENIGDKFRTNLKVAEKPTGRQKALLDKLGYNSWRKLSVNSK
jgi:hypothetical protein